MNKSLKLIIFVITLCLVGMFTACSIIDLWHNDNNNTVDGLPEVKLTEDMTLDDLISALENVNNYRCHVTGESIEENTVITSMSGKNAEMDVISTEKGVITIVDYGSDLLTYQTYFKENNCYYDLKGNSSTNEYYYYISTSSIDYSGFDYEEYFEYQDSFITQMLNYPVSNYKVEDGQLYIDYTISGTKFNFKFYDFNKNTLNIEKYFPGYKSLDIGTNLPESTLYNSYIVPVEDTLHTLKSQISMYRVDIYYSTSWATTNSGTKKGLCAFLQENLTDVTIIENATTSYNTKPEGGNLVIWCDTATNLKEPSGGASDTKFTIYVANEYYIGSITFEKDKTTTNEAERWE